jgi:hypothetical protein
MPVVKATITSRLITTISTAQLAQIQVGTLPPLKTGEGESTGGGVEPVAGIGDGGE